MTRLLTGTLRLAASSALLVLLTVPVRAGDEDISPSPYQEFDPVTGYMVTIDPAKDQPQGHGQAQDETTPDPPPAETGSSNISWLQAFVAVAAIVAATGLLRRLRRSRAASGH